MFYQEEFVKARMGRKDGNQMSESYTENEEVFADIVISGRIFDGDGLSAMTMKVGDQANLTVYDEKVDVYSELEQSESKVLMKIENGEIIYRSRKPGNRTCAGTHFLP